MLLRYTIIPIYSIRTPLNNSAQQKRLSEWPEILFWKTTTETSRRKITQRHNIEERNDITLERSGGYLQCPEQIRRNSNSLGQVGLFMVLFLVKYTNIIHFRRSLVNIAMFFCQISDSSTTVMCSTASWKKSYISSPKNSTVRHTGGVLSEKLLNGSFGRG